MENYLSCAVPFWSDALKTSFFPRSSRNSIASSVISSKTHENFKAIINFRP